ncbi:hypothetical protein FSP39_001984 [Pinctada imbricata]|uniref:Metalloendopeptidase n=1 Tax=Pinctada imbricata TaxID=66713 RepID=A0AA89BVR5_PINIB|nr:hypothetical protein FSP39_001984 [Pinctada imbricata]
MQKIMDKTMVNGKKCIDFQPRTNERAFIQFTYGSGCHTPVGYHGRESDVTLGNGCYRKGTVIHEILHALGFYHEQDRCDVDNYLKIHYENIQKGHERNIEKYTKGPNCPFDDLNLPFDYGSVMLYSAYAFAIDRRKPTLEPLQPGVTIGQRMKLSDLDAKKIQVLYGCIPRPAPLTGSGAVTGAPTSPPHIVQTTPTNYLYMEASGHTNKTAKLLSPTYSPGLYCFAAYFHMYGAQTGYLSFNLMQNGRTYHMKTYRGDHGDRWTALHLSVNVHSTSFHFEIEGHTGNGYHSDIAIDDISVTPGHC